IHANERLLETPTPSCQPKITSDPVAGDKAGEATVALSYLCTGYVYDRDGAAQVAASLLTARAPALLTLNGKTTATVTSATLVDPQQAIIRLTVAVQGVWVLRL